MLQEEINALLVELGQAGKTVVRLKGGDPYIFGRGGEEALDLLEAGIPFEVVPGIRARCGPGLRGHSGNASRGVYLRGFHHGPRGSDESGVRCRMEPARQRRRHAGDVHGDWTSGADLRRTHLCRQRPRYARRLCQVGTTADQQTVSARSGDIAEKVAEAD